MEFQIFAEVMKILTNKRIMVKLKIKSVIEFDIQNAFNDVYRSWMRRDV